VKGEFGEGKSSGKKEKRGGRDGQGKKIDQVKWELMTFRREQTKNKKLGGGEKRGEGGKKTVA